MADSASDRPVVTDEMVSAAVCALASSLSETCDDASLFVREALEAAMEVAPRYPGEIFQIADYDRVLELADAMRSAVVARTNAKAVWKAASVEEHRLRELMYQADDAAQQAERALLEHVTDNAV